MFISLDFAVQRISFVTRPKPDLVLPANMGRNGRYKDRDCGEMSQYCLDDTPQFPEHELWEHDSDQAPTPGYCGSPYAALSTLSPSL